MGREFSKLNCLLLMQRKCTTKGKGDMIAYLMTIDGGPKGDLITVGHKPIGGVDDE